ncbi:MAG: carotenoid oxygenase family protein [Leptolyngbyaceae bacterium]|nr:carotenoid oxygenase family protein [Leptolyngbyaceae bacterium]
MTSVAPNSQTTLSPAPRFPRSIFSVSRAEVDHAPLTIKQGLTDADTSLAADLSGYLFIVGPAGTVDSPWEPDNPCLIRPTRDGYTPLYNGDGMVYRIQFDQGQAYLKTKIAQTASFIADEIVHGNPDYPELSFQNFGIARNSVYLGASTQLSVTLTPVRFAVDDPYRILLTVDMGRPHEIDPVTLEIVQPIGLSPEWKLVNPLFGIFPFPLVMSCAHPSFDFEHQELYTINLGRSMSQFLPTVRQVLVNLPGIQQMIKLPLPPSTSDPLQVPKQALHQLWHWVSDGVTSVLGSGLVQVRSLQNTWQTIAQLVDALDNDDYVELLRWRGEAYDDAGKGKCFERWQVVLENGRPLKIHQTLHQMWVTKHFIVLVDTAFKISLEELLPFEYNITINDLEALMRNLTDIPQLADTPVYIIRRDDLDGPSSRSPRTVTARQLTIPREIAHYVVEYEDKDGIVLHTVHSCATDAAETIRHFDTSAFPDKNTPQLAGMLADGMDINWIGSYVINPNAPAETALKSCLIKQDFCWGDPVYAYRNMTLESSDQIDDMYWIFFGGWEELLSEYVADLYHDYKYRTYSADYAREANRQGQATTLCRVHIERSLNADQELELTLTTPDVYTFPPSHFANSPQFIPRQGGDGGFTDGYITCLVFSETTDGTAGKALWIFDAAHLSQGPQYRLSSPKLNCGFTIHTTWLPDIAPAPASHYDPQQDFEPHVAKLVRDYQHSLFPIHHHIATQIRRLFDQIYQRFHHQ